LWQTRAYGELQLSIVELLLTLSPTHFALGGTLTEHASAAQHGYWQAIFEQFSSAEAIVDEAPVNLKLLTDALLAGQLYGALYDAKARDAFCAPWLALQSEMNTLACYQALMLTASRLEIDIAPWLKDKEHHLLASLDLVRQQGLQQAVYW
ncbi:MAG: adenylate cyclase, partial [Shewanella sp.]